MAAPCQARRAKDKKSKKIINFLDGGKPAPNTSINGLSAEKDRSMAKYAEPRILPKGVRLLEYIR
mgnify:CR=1 FL=1